MVRLTAEDGHELDAYQAKPQDTPLGGVVVIQEVFGLTAHIKRVVDRYAEAGFAAIAPAMFDRVERDIVLDYSDLKRGLATMQQLEWPDTMTDVRAAVAAVDDELAVAVVGFCWGGTVAYVAAGELPIAAAVSYYGGGVARLLDKKPTCPVMYHFGDRDHSIPPADIEKIKLAHPAGVYHVYPGAGHAFNCEDRASFSGPDAALALERSLRFLREHLA